MKPGWKPLILAVLACSVPGAATYGETKLRADRTPLTYRDSGLYCNYFMVHGVEPENMGIKSRVKNMLPASRAASAEAPWTFYVMQYHAPKKRRPEFDGSLIRDMVRAGKKVILRAAIGRGAVNPDIDELDQRLINMLEEVDPDLLYAITLDEENIYWRGWDKVLPELYHRCKKRWPDLPVYQWWTPMEVPNLRADSGWVALPADGWVIDLYGMPREAFEKKVLMCLETGKPLIHIAWASPDWPQYSGGETWERGGRKIFDDQREVCRAYNIPVGYFCTQKYLEVDGQRIRPIFWGWHATNPEVRAWYRELEALVMNLRTLPDDQIGFRTPNQRLFDWAHGSSRDVDLTYVLDEKERKRFAWRAHGRSMPYKPGEHGLETPYANPHVRLTLILDESASRLDGRPAVRSIQGHANRVPLVFRVEPRQPLEDVRVTARVVATRSAGGSAHLAVSVDGADWSSTVATDPSRKTSDVTVASPIDGRSDAPFWVRLMLEATAGVPTDPAATLKWIEVSGVFEPRL